MAVTPTGRSFLGDFGNQAVNLNLTDLSSHTALTIEFDLYLLRTWDGTDPGGWGTDTFTAKLDGQTLVSNTFANRTEANAGHTNHQQTYGGVGAPPGLYPGFTGATEAGTLGYNTWRAEFQRYEDMSSVYRLTFTVPHIATTANFQFAGSGLQGLGDESWGLDNVQVTAKVALGNWTWGLAEDGKIYAKAAEGDTLQTLVNQGYDKERLLELAAAQSIQSVDVALPKDFSLNISSLFSSSVQEVLVRQQQMSYEELRQVVEYTPGGPNNVPQGKTVGNSGVNWLQGNSFGDDGQQLTGKYSSNKFGWQNCYGFVGLAIGVELPNGATAYDFGMAALTSEPVAGAIDDEARVYNPFQQYLPDPRYDSVRTLVPEMGLIKTLTGGGMKSDTPSFGAVALFKQSTNKYAHAAIVLGKNENGGVYVLQKLNAAEPYAVTLIDHPRVAVFGTPEYYAREMM
ncbi:MAG: hypothetical protein LC104_07310 [Bacteroidales bacterium]|nr:hypothetical protein [Bacteroidales bacterium]